MVRGRSRVKDAAGPRDGDLVIVQNQWAKVVITRLTDERGTRWRVSGDVPLQGILTTGSEAMNYALDCLGEAQRATGRVA